MFLVYAKVLSCKSQSDQKYIINAFWPHGGVLGERYRFVSFGSSNHHGCEHLFWYNDKN